MGKVYLCYERNSPDLAAQLATCDSDGSVSGYRIKSSADKAGSWISARILAGIDGGYYVDTTRDLNLQQVIESDLYEGRTFSVTMFNLNDDSLWYDIVVEPIFVE